MTKVSKSQVVREFLAEHPNMGPSEAARQIKSDKNVAVTASLVSFVRSTRGRHQAAVSAESKTSVSVTLDHILRFKDLIREIGTDNAKQLLELLS